MHSHYENYKREICQQSLFFFWIKTPYHFADAGKYLKFYRITASKDEKDIKSFRNLQFVW
jgi:hypothetical protein